MAVARRAGAVLVGVVGMLVLACCVSTAQAATIYGSTGRFQQVSYSAGNGERNVVSLSGTAQALRLRDPGALILPDLATLSVCTALIHDARCNVGGPTGLGLGDQDDVATANTTHDVSFFGDAGNDRLSGGGEQDQFAGGAGSDDLSGGPGDDLYNGLYEVGGGRSITLDDVANDGLPGENDNVHGDVEDVYLGGGDDTIVGNEANNGLLPGAGRGVIDARGGADVVITANGDDTIDAGPGLDFVRAGAGNDTIDARDGDSDTVDCGDGADTVSADAADTLDGCENVLP